MDGDPVSLPDKAPVTTPEPSPVAAGSPRPTSGTALSRMGEFFQEDNGGFSMNRLITFLIIVVPLLIWAGISLYHWAMTDYPGGVLSLQFGALGSKLIQKPMEQKVE
jgi:hypothetical protein